MPIQKSHRSRITNIHIHLTQPTTIGTLISRTRDVAIRHTHILTRAKHTLPINRIATITIPTVFHAGVFVAAAFVETCIDCHGSEVCED